MEQKHGKLVYLRQNLMFNDNLFVFNIRNKMNWYLTRRYHYATGLGDNLIYLFEICKF